MKVLTGEQFRRRPATEGDVPFLLELRTSNYDCAPNRIRRGSVRSSQSDGAFEGCLDVADAIVGFVSELI
jgi:hypothetical protein